MIALRARLLPALLALLLLAGCGDGQAASETVRDATDPRAGETYGAPATENVRVVPVVVEIRDLPRGWDGMRIAAISDFKLGRWIDNAEVAEVAIRRAAEARPDLVVLLGDFVDRGDQLGALERALAPLRGRPTFAVLGDGDSREDVGATPDSAEIRLVAVLQGAGVTLLRNARAPMVRGGDTAFIGGIEPFAVRRPEWRQAEILNSVAGSTVLLSHMPGILARTGVTQRTFPLVLAGNTGCGQVEPPGVVGLARLQNEILPGALLPGTDRAFRTGESTLLVTCGVGYSYIPVRVGAPPEVLLVTLRRIAPAGEPQTVETLVPDSLLRQFQVGDSVSADTADTAAPTAPVPPRAPAAAAEP